MKNLIIIGARGHGRAVCAMALAQGKYNVKGFLDSKTDALGELSGYYPPILNSVEDYKIEEGDVFICALGDLIYRKKYSHIIIDKGGEFVSVIHPTTIIDSTVRIGIGCNIGAYNVIDSGSVIEDHVMIQHHVVFGHDAKVGAWSRIDSNVFIGGYTEVEHESIIHTGAVVLPQVCVAQGTIVGASAMVNKSTSSETVVVGIPAKILK